MKKQSNPLETLTDIRSFMERSTQFISLNGLSGVFAGIFALLGSFVYFYHSRLDHLSLNHIIHENGGIHMFSVYRFICIDALSVLAASLMVAIFLSYRKACKNGLKIWDHSARRLLINMLIPLATGGLFCIILIYHGLIEFVAPSTLIFYGLALVNASKYTLYDIRYLGMIQLGIGLIAAIWVGYGLLFWAIGFGLVHIIYGTMMYLKYER